MFRHATVECYDSEADWLDARRTGIGGAEIAGVLGLARFQTPGSLWATKCRLIDDPGGELERLRWGRRLQRPIADGYATDTGRTLIDPGPYTLIRSTRWPWLFATPDYFQSRDPLEPVGVLDVKNASAWTRRDWYGEPPVPYQFQLQQQMLITDVSWGTLAALVGGDALVYADLAPEPEAVAWILEESERFWQCVVDRTPPAALDGSEQTTRALARLYPTAQAGVTRPLASLELEAADQLITHTEAHVKLLQEQIDAAKNMLRAAIGDAEAGQLSSGVVWTMKTETRKGYTVPDWTGRKLRRKGPA